MNSGQSRCAAEMTSRYSGCIMKMTIVYLRITGDKAIVHGDYGRFRPRSEKMQKLLGHYVRLLENQTTDSNSLVANDPDEIATGLKAPRSSLQPASLARMASRSAGLSALINSSVLFWQLGVTFQADEVARLELRTESQQHRVADAHSNQFELSHIQRGASGGDLVSDLNAPFRRTGSIRAQHITADQLARYAYSPALEASALHGKSHWTAG
jgi:hypothetical protein